MNKNKKHLQAQDTYAYSDFLKGIEPMAKLTNEQSVPNYEIDLDLDQNAKQSKAFAGSIVNAQLNIGQHLSTSPATFGLSVLDLFDD